MPVDPIDLEVSLQSLQGIKEDLESYYWSLGDQGAERWRYAIGVSITLLGQRISALEEVVRHHGRHEIRVADLSLDEHRAVDRALGILDGEFVADGTMRESRVFSRVRAFLAAADDLLLAVARGMPVEDAEHHDGPRPGVVLPLVRQSR